MHSLPSDKRFKMLSASQSQKFQENMKLCNNVKNLDQYRNKQMKERYDENEWHYKSDYYNNDNILS